MACERIDLKGGSVVICMRGKRVTREPKCSVTGCNSPSTILCDFPLSGAKAGKTCDRKCCRAHAAKQAVRMPATALVRADEVFPPEVIGPEEKGLIPGHFGKRVTVQEEEPDTVDYCPAHAKLVAATPPAQRELDLGAPAKREGSDG